MWIDLRRQLFPERDAPITDRCTAGGFERVVGRGSTGPARVLIAEGVPALPERNGSESAAQCGGGALSEGQMIFDICNPFIVKRTGANVGDRCNLQVGPG